jgi:hypothetical protein
MREIVSAISAIQTKKEEPSPEKLVACIAEAKKHGLTDLAQSLEARLITSFVSAPTFPIPLLPPLGKKNGK